jgi:predicted transcriptional regulator
MTTNDQSNHGAYDNGTNNVMNKYRSRDEIIHEILSLLADSPQMKTRIMYRAYLSYGQLRFYAGHLIEKGLIEQRTNMLSLTDKGRAYLLAYQKAQQILET